MWTEYCVYKSTSESFCFPNAEDTIICAKYELREWFNERMIRSFLGGRYGRKWITNSSEKSSINSSSHFHTLVVLGNCGLHCDEDCVFHVKSNFHEVVESNVSDFLNGKHSCTTFLRFTERGRELTNALLREFCSLWAQNICSSLCRL